MIYWEKLFLGFDFIDNNFYDRALCNKAFRYFRVGCMMYNRLRHIIKHLPGLKLVYLKIKNRKVTFSGFNGDPITQKIVQRIISFFEVTSFFETGTWHGDTSGFVAKNNRKLPVYSCEINGNFYEYSKERLRKLKNAHVFNQNSVQFLSKSNTDLLNVGNTPLFHLDAHWYDYWPILDELEIILTNTKTSIITIDDCEVPDRPDYRFDVGGGGSLSWSGKKINDDRPLNLNLINPVLTKMDYNYNILFPSYSSKDPNKSQLNGYIIIFVNLRAKFEKFLQGDPINQYFKEYSLKKGCYKSGSSLF